MTEAPHSGQTELSAAERRLAQLTAVTEAGLAIARARLEEDGLCELVYQHASGIVEANSFHLGLFEEERFTLKVWIKDGERQPATSFEGAQDAGIVGWMRAAQRPLLVRDFTLEQDDLPARPSYMDTDPPRSALFVPLVAGDTVVGSLSAQSPQPDAYDEDDLQLLNIIANQAAAAIANARLFKTAQRRAEHLATIAELARTITAVLDLDDLLAQVVELICDRFGYYHVQVFLVESETHRAIFRASTGHRVNQLWLEQGRSLAFAEGIIGWVAATGRHLLANDVTIEPRYIADDPRLLPDTRSELAVPLVVEGEVLGVLDVQSRQIGAFGAEDLYVLTTLANQVAVAVEAARAYQAQQEEAWVTAVLLQIAEAASRADTLEDVLGTVTRLVPMLVGVDSCGIWLRDEELDIYEPAAAFGLTIPWTEAESALRLRPTIEHAPALALMQQNLEPVELDADEAFLLPPAMIDALSGDHILLLPLLSQNRIIGSLIVSLQREQTPVRNRQKRSTLLGGIANQAAAAIENVRLTSAAREEAWISWALLQVSQAIGSAHTADEMLEHVVRLSPMLVSVDRCAVFLFEPASETFILAQEYLEHPGRQHSLAGMRLAAGDLPLLDLARVTRRAHRVDDVQGSELVPPSWVDLVGSKTLLALPLVTMEELYGVMLVDDVDTPYMVSQRRQDILTGLAQQVALALENFRLQAQERERLRMTEELSVARRIQSSFLPEETPAVPGYELAHIWQAAREVGGDFYDVIPLADGRLGLFIADVADKGVPAALFMAISLTLLRTSARNFTSPRTTLNRANQLIGANNRAGMFVTVWYGVLDPAIHRLDFSNAGHSLALHVRAEDGDIRRLQTPGIPLGIMDQANLGQSSCTLAPGDLLVLYTDGIIDAINDAEEDFGQDRLEALLFSQRQRTAREIIDSIVASVTGHAGNAPVFDDITIMIVKRQPD